MNDYQKQLVEQSFRHVVPMAEQAALLFYQRLFELDPSLRPLFKGDMQQQGLKLMNTLKVAVNSLYRLDDLLPTLQNLGRSHVRYGVRGEHYATVGQALIWTLEQGLGDAFTDDVRDAWQQVYELLSGVMIEATQAEPNSNEGGTDSFVAISN